MVVQVKVCVNADEINEVKKKNDYYAQQRLANEKRPKKDKVIIPEDLELPEQKVECFERFWDVKDVVEAWISEFNKDLISVVHLYSQVKFIVYTDEVWEQLKTRFQ